MNKSKYVVANKPSKAIAILICSPGNAIALNRMRSNEKTINKLGLGGLKTYSKTPQLCIMNNLIRKSYGLPLMKL